jgi:DNA-binding transcriptional ArsR family regulator
MFVAETFKALGDPVRLQIIERLSAGTAYTLSSVSNDLGITRQGVRKHLKVLEDANLISLQQAGRNINIQFKPKSLIEANSFIEQIERKWDERLLALRDYVEQGNN